MPDADYGHEDEIRQQTFVLNRPFMQEAGADRVAAYCQVLVELSRESVSAGQDELEARLRERLAAADVAVPEPSFAITAEQLFRSQGHIAIVTDDGEVLYGPPRSAQDSNNPDVRGTEDPDDPDRPVYS